MKFEVSLFILVMKMESDISKITLALASCPGQPAARCARGNLAPTRRTEMVATNNSMEFVWKNLIYYVSNQIFWNSLEDPYRHHFCTVSYGMGNAMIILYQGFGSHWGTFSWGKTEVLYCSRPPPLFGQNKKERQFFLRKTFLSD